jgi:hypothetical protein
MKPNPGLKRAVSRGSISDKKVFKYAIPDLSNI